MDAVTQSVIVVIAHPIAGNPSQFAVERALKSMELDWRVLSFDVRPDDVPAALQGFAVTGIAGVLIDPSLQAAASDWYQATGAEESGTIDCLYRDEARKFVGVNQQRRWLSDLIGQTPSEDSEAGGRIWFGESLSDSVVDRDSFPSEPAFVPVDPETIKDIKWIALSEGVNGPVELEVDEWPENDGAVHVIDLTSGRFLADHPELSAIAALGYRTINICDRKIGVLQRCLQRWTGSGPSADVLRDAIEEYLGV
jgi:hypothetical protein